MLDRNGLATGHEADTAVVMLMIVPLEELDAEGAGILD